MAKFQEYSIYKKRDGQSFELKGSIYADGFIKAKKEFAKNCANDMHKECWLSYFDASNFDKKGLESGFYLNENLVYNEDETVNVENSYIECFLSQKAIDKGFDTFSEDVYTWQIRKN